jgi:hypothetical protein
LCEFCVVSFELFCVSNEREGRFVLTQHSRRQTRHTDS